MTTEIIVAAGIAALVQLIQAGIEMARLSGLTEEQIKQVFAAEQDKFNQNTPDKLPE